MVHPSTDTTYCNFPSVAYSLTLKNLLKKRLKYFSSICVDFDFPMYDWEHRKHFDLLNEFEFWNSIGVIIKFIYTGMSRNSLNIICRTVPWVKTIICYDMSISLRWMFFRKFVCMCLKITVHSSSSIRHIFVHVLTIQFYKKSFKTF